MNSQRDGIPQETSASAARRRTLSQRWLSEAEVDAKLGGSLAATLARRAGKILGVWISDEGRYLYPDFQFGPQEPLEAMSVLLTWLPSASGSGWDQVEWLCSPHALLDKRTPAEVLLGDPRAVVTIAEREFSEDPDARW